MSSESGQRERGRPEPGESAGEDGGGDALAAAEREGIVRLAIPTPF